MSHPILYSYRRCPYAMRARMAIWASGLQVEQREIVFWDKPKAMLQASSKGTVPVLVLPDRVLEESQDIMVWALQQNDANGWGQKQQESLGWLAQCEAEFKPHLDHYKYPEQFPDMDALEARYQAVVFLERLDKILEKQAFLLGESVALADVALFPFVRQFAHVDKAWFEKQPLLSVKRWLSTHLEADYFQAVMKNRPVWEAVHHPLWVNEPELMRKDQMRAKALGLPQPRR